MTFLVFRFILCGGGPTISPTLSDGTPLPPEVLFKSFTLLTLPLFYFTAPILLPLEELTLKLIMVQRAHPLRARVIRRGITIDISE